MAGPKFQIIRGGRLLNIRDPRADPANILKALSAKLEDLVGQYCVGLARQPYHIQHTVAE